MLKLKISRVANMVFLIDQHANIFRAWNVTDFSQRKLANAMRKIRANAPCEVTLALET